MTLLTLAVKNVRHQWRSYAAFFLSSSFAVWLFFVYGSLLYHPSFGPNKLPPNVRQLMLYMEVLVALFALLFTLYAHSAFVKSRQRELGLLTTLGMLPRQIAGMVWRENLTVGLGATVTGIGVGTVSGPLFFLGIGRILDLPEPAPFFFSPRAALLTLIGFGLLFSLISLTTLFTLRRLSVADVLREAAKPKAPPRFSPWLAALSLLCTGGAYYLAWYASTGRASNDQSGDVLLLGLVGTYLFFTQGSALVLRVLKQRRQTYWRGANLINLAQLSYKMRDNARILFMITVLTAGVLTMITLFYASYLSSEVNAEQHYPVALTVEAPAGLISPNQVDGILAQEGVRVKATERVSGLLGWLGNHQGGEVSYAQVPIIAVSDANRWAAALTQTPPLSVTSGAATVVMSDHYPWSAGTTVDLYFDRAVKAPDVRLPLDQTVVAKLFDEPFVVVVDDQLMATLERQHGDRTLTLAGWNFVQWRESLTASLRILDALGQDRQMALVGGQRFVWGTALFAYSQRRGMAFMFFLLGFISILFFLASGNMLYFKLFTDLQEDRRQFQALFKLGLGVDDVRRILTTQTLTLFFAPFLVALAHTAMILMMADQGMGVSIWWPLGVVSLIYLLLHGTYFLVTRRTYTRAVLGQ
ncbi:MAG: FtsX-like permease family protein [Mycobacterium leprae]